MNFKRIMAVLICFMLILTSFQFVASAEDRLSTNKTEYEVGENILVTATGSGVEWVGLFRADETPSAENGSYFWYYVDGVSEGVFTSASGQTQVIQNAINNDKGPLNPGEYKVCLLGVASDDYRVHETVYISIVGASTSRFKANKTEYVEGEPILITADASGKDWIGIYEKGAAPSLTVNSIYWIYASASSGEPYSIQEGDAGRATHDYSAGNFFGLPAGEYDLVYCLNDGYTEFERQTIKIKAAVYDNLSTDKNEYVEGEDVFVTAEGVGQKVALFKVADAENALPIYEYVVSDETNGKAFKIQSGTLNRPEEADLTYGSYKVVMFDSEEKVVATVYFNVDKRPFDEILPDEQNKEQTGKNGLLKTDKVQYKMGEPIMVTATVSEEQAAAKAWVGIVPQGVTVSAGGAVSSYWYYVNDTRYGAQNGMPFDIFKGDGSNSQYQSSYYPITDGYYDIILFAADGYEVLDIVTISRYTPGEIGKDLVLDKVTYTEGEPVYITATSPDENAWVGIYDKDTIPGPELAKHWYWVSYVNGISQDIMSSVISSGNSLPAGEYKAVLFNDDGYGNIEKTVYFTIEKLDVSNTTFDFTINGKAVEIADRIEVMGGEKVVVNATAVGEGVGYSWVGIYKLQLSSDTDFTQIKSDDWKYISEINGQDWDITGSLAEGPNTVALFSNSGYDGIVKYVWIYVERADVVSKEVISEATCTEPGVTHYVYKDGTEEDILVMPLGHKYIKGNEMVEATPDSIGGVKSTCERCGNVDLTQQVKFDISKATISVATKLGVKEPIVSVEYNGQKLVEGTHYEVTFSDTNEGKIATIVGVGKCSGIVQKPYGDAKHNLADAIITVADAMYTGKEVKPTVLVKYNDAILTEGVDYELKYSDNVNVGLGKVTVTGKGEYEGSVEKTFKIKTAASSVVNVKLSKTTFVYNGKVQKPNVTVLADGKELTRDNYTVTFAKNSKKVGKYSVVVTLKGDYKGVITQTFVINPQATKLNSVVAGKKSMTVKWAKKTKEVSGYEIVYSANKKFKKSVTVKVKKAKTAKKVIKKLKANKKYFVKIRTFKKVGKTTFVSAFSKAKTVKTK